MRNHPFRTLNNDSFAAFTVPAALLVLLVAMASSAGPLWMQGGDSGRITGLACSTDGNLIVSASDDATVKIWSTNGTLLRTLGSPCQATAVAISPDGMKIAVGTYYGGFAFGNVSRSGYYSIPGLGLINLWQAPSGWSSPDVSLVRTSTNLYGKITALAFSPDGARLAAGNASGSNTLYQVSNGAVLATRGAYNSTIGPAAVSTIAYSSASLVVSGCEDKTLRAWNASWSPVWTNYSHASNVTAIAFSGDGGLLASASLDRNIRIWSTTNWSCLQILVGQAGETNSFSAVAFSPDGQTLASGSLDGSVKIWSRAGGTWTTQIAAHGAPVTAVAFLPDGNRIVSGGEDHRINIWSATDGSLVQCLGGHTDFVRSLAISPDAMICASAGHDSAIQLRRSADGILLRTLTGTTGFVSAITFAPDSAVLASSGGPLDPDIKLWRVNDGTVLRTLTAETNGAMALAFSPDGSMLAAGGDFDEQTIRLLNPNDGMLLRELAGHTNGVTALAFSPRGDYLATGGRRFDNTVKIWVLSDGGLVRTFFGHSNNVESIAFSPDGDTVASGSSGTNALLVWRVSDGSSRRFGSITNPVFFVSFSPDGSVLASADQDSIRYWDVATGNLVQTATQEMFQASSFAYSPNGNLILCGRADASLVMSTNGLGALDRVPLAFSSVHVAPATPTMLNATVQPLTHYVIESSANLLDWDFVTLGLSQSNSLTLFDTNTNASPARYYRAITPP